LNLNFLGNLRDDVLHGMQGKSCKVCHSPMAGSWVHSLNSIGS
jgi:hypothetical protein